MRPELEPSVNELLIRVDGLSQWEQAELGRSLRRSGWTYTEIAGVIPAAKSTIAGWCREIELSPAQIRAIKERTGSRAGIPRNTQWRRREERALITANARSEVPEMLLDPYWVAGIVLYWDEGFKTENALGLANSDADLVRLFMDWTRTYLDEDVQFRAKLNLHANNDVEKASAFWAQALGLTALDFAKPFIKPDGTGHRRNHLEHGVVQVRARRSTDLFLRTSGWIDGLRTGWKTAPAND